LTAITRPVGRWRIQALPIRTGHFGWLALSGLLTARIALSAVQISHPGLNYDETQFVNAATLRIQGLWIFHSIAGIPLMVYPYTGAVKSWLYDPIFGIFGTSPTTIRLPVVLLVSAGLVLVYLAVRDLVNRPVAVLAFGALCFDQSLMWLTRDDVGPSALELFIKCALLWGAARFAASGSRRWVWLLLALLGLGVLNKLDFIWIVNAAAAISLALMIWHRHQLGAHWRTAAVWIAGLAAIYAAFLAYYVTDHPDRISHYRGAAIGQPWHAFQEGIRQALSGTGFYNYALGPLHPRDVVVVIVLALFAVGSLASVRAGSTCNRPIALLALATPLIALQNLLTPEATKAWHYIAIYPFVTIVAAYGAYVIVSWRLGRSTAASGALAGLLALMLAYDGSLLARYLTGISTKDPAPHIWSPAIYRLSDALERMPGKVYAADWGIANQLFALHPSRRFVDLSFTLDGATRSAAVALGRGLERVRGAKLFVTHPTSSLQFPGVNANLFTALRGHLRLDLTVTGYHGERVYLVYRYR
jgi:4-amino-4-deoxy-L-arabinose transferase-like glycosyltransferase